MESWRHPFLGGNVHALHVGPAAGAAAVRAGRAARLAAPPALDIADAVAYIVTRPRRVAVNEMLVRPTNQEM